MKNLINRSVISVLQYLVVVIGSALQAQTSVTLTSSKDDFVYEHDSNFNHGTCDGLALENYDNYNSRSFVEFNTSSINSTSTITSAQLVLTHYNWSYWGEDSSVPFSARRVTGPWTEGDECWGNATGSQLRWSNQPSTTGNYGSQTANASHSNGTLYTFDVTSLVQGWVDGTFTNYGIGLIPNSTNGNGYISVYSETGGANRPRLEITYLDTSCTDGATVGIVTVNDPDADGINNACDLDDDNDGILDSVECETTVTYTSLNNTASYSYAQDSDGDEAKHFNEGGNNEPMRLFDGNVNTEFRLHEDDIIEFSFGQTILAGAVLVLDEGSGGEDKPVTVYVSNGTTDPNGDGGLGVGYQNTIANSTLVYSGSSGSDVTFTMPIDATHVQFFGGDSHGGWGELRFQSNTQTTVDYSNCDFDNDGIPNHLDTDSDNDGCSDAIEGGASFDNSNTNSNDELTGSIDSNGVPTIVTASGQSLGSSQNASVQDADCVDQCDPSSGNIDTDGDGITDICDLDDDNDGILDSVELTATTTCVATTTPVGVVPNSNIQSGPLSLINDGVVNANNGVAHNNTAHYLVIDLGQIYDSGSILKFDWWTNNGSNRKHTITQKPSSAYSVGGANSLLYTYTNSQTLGFFEYTLDAATRYVQVDMTARSGGRVEILEATITTSCTAADTDGDGIPNNLDLDSDGDGCPDAIEGSSSYTISDLTANATFDGGSTDVTYNLGLGLDSNLDGLLDLVGPSGQGTGGSADESINSCPLVVDFDGFDDLVKTPPSFNINNWNTLTIQFWAKSNNASQSHAGIIGQKGVLEITQNGRLECALFNQGAEGVFSDALWLNDTDTWQHVTLVYNNGLIQLYYNGIKQYEAASSAGTTLGSSSERFNIGGKIKTGATSNFYNGWLDEVRVFDVALTASQIQQMIHQEIEENSGFVKGTVIPKYVKDFTTSSKISWEDLRLYYRFGTSFTDRKITDYSQSSLHASLVNIYTQQTETAPLPYKTVADGNWDNPNTWLHGDVWNIPGNILFQEDLNSSNQEAAIVQISHNIILDSDISSHSLFANTENIGELKTVGLLIDSGKILTLGGNNADYAIKNSSYLALNGALDLMNDSQLIQTVNSDLVTSVDGKILRRQEGTSSAYCYNYWGSPVGVTSVSSLVDNNMNTTNSNNTNYRINMLKKGDGANVQFTNAYDEIGKVSTRWLYTYKNGVTYYDYLSLNQDTNIQPGVGYTQKGTGNSGAQQYYIFEGKPNNGTIVINAIDTGGNGSVPTVSKTDYFLGNPYPSALDIHKFIDDNAGVIDGTIQLWQQWSGSSHYLDLYDGGYAQVNKTGSVRAYQFIGIEGANNGSQVGTKVPTKYLPVGQGFMTEIVNNGTIVFKNSQRVFIKEADANGSYTSGSVFFRTNDTSADRNSTSQEDAEEEFMQKIRLEFNAVDGPATKRELLLGFSDFTTDDYDYGYDAKNIDENGDDLNLVLDDQNMMIQAYSAITAEKSVPLNFKASGSYNYRIELTQLENIELDQEIYLKDNLTGVYFDLTTDQHYEFSSEIGTFNNRFEIIFEAGEALSTEDQDYQYNLIYFNNDTNKLFVKGLQTDVKNVQIINMLGQTVQEFNQVQAQTLNNGLEISNLTTGAYVIYLKTDSIFKTKKIIIN
jgi:hypothetical protein